ncbi:MAG: hypothetical protein HUK25_09530 [Treponema sp.]|nr:hypothetical protein [Clostridia bacterium]MCF0242869.1 hypothetical protein [Treponema sp.]
MEAAAAPGLMTSFFPFLRLLIIPSLIALVIGSIVFFFIISIVRMVNADKTDQKQVKSRKKCLTAAIIIFAVFVALPTILWTTRLMLLVNNVIRM